MVKTQIYLNREQFISLKYSAAKNKTSYAELIREAVSDYLNKLELSKPKKINWSKKAKKVSTSMGGKIASTIDEELYT